MPNGIHPRYKTYRIESPCRNSSCPENGPDLKIIFFINDEKLRSHAIKHLADTNEIDIFKKLSNDVKSSHNVIIKYSDSIKDIGCPYYTQSTYSDPPCLSCKIYNQCSQYAKSIEDIYIKAIDATLLQGIAIPRYACYHNSEYNLKYFATVARTKAVVHAYYANDYKAYNMLTCYCGLSNNKLGDFLNFQQTRIHQQAMGRGSVIWCKPDNWQPPAGNQNKRPRYRRGSGKAREFLKKWK